MLLDVWFDGYKITDYCMVRNIFPLVAGRGASLLLEINITIKDDIRYNLDKLNQILFTKEPRPLIISDTPGRQLMCELNGGIELTSRFVAGDATLSFVAEEPYWYSTEGEKSVFSDGFGTIKLTNEGTAPALPRFTVSFPTETGFLSIVAPNGYLALGDKEEKTKLELPKQQLALKETFSSSAMSGWTRLTSDSHAGGLWVPDYNKLSLTTGEPYFDGAGVRPTKSSTPKSGYYWNSWGYTKNFATLPNQEHRLTNFKLNMNVVLEHTFGGYDRTGMFLIVVMDKNNRPIVTTSIYNVEANSNEVTVTAKVNDFSGGGNYRSKIVRTEKFPNGLNSLSSLQMSKEGNRFTWLWDSGKTQSSSSSTNVVERFSVGSTAYIKNDATWGYGYDGVRHSIKSFTRGRPYYVQATRTWNGKTQYLISYQGTQIYWMDLGDLTKNRSGVGETKQQTSNAKRTTTYSLNDAGLATLVADKVLIVGGTWDNSSPFSFASLRHLEVQRLNEGDRFVDIANTFQQGDTLVIDNGTGEITHNGLVYQGKKDVDSRFFDIDYGPNELQVVTSSWGGIPQVRCDFTERYR